MFQDTEGNFHPHIRAKEDNYYEKKAREKYWQKRQLGRE